MRAEAVKAFVLLDPVSPEATWVVRDALHGNEVNLLVYGLMGAPKLGLDSGVDRAGGLLSHSDRRVRLAAGTALQAYGVAARSQLARIHQAAASETDAAVSATLEALLTALEPRG